MWKQLGDYIKQVFQIQQETQKNKADIVELRQELKEVQKELRHLTAAMQQIAHEVIRNHQNEVHEREKLVLRLEHEREKMALRFELELLRAGRQLPMNPPDKEQGENQDRPQLRLLLPLPRPHCPPGRRPGQPQRRRQQPRSLGP